MLPSETLLVVLSLFLLIWMTFATLGGAGLLSNMIVTIVLCLPFLGTSTFTAFGYSSNTGNIFFTVALHGIALKYLVAGFGEARKGVRNVLCTLTIVMGCTMILQETHILGPLFDARIQVAGARLIAFCMVQPAFVYLLNRRSTWPFIVRAPLIEIAMLAFDCLVFFPEAFAGVLPVEIIVQFAIVGFLTRVAVTMMAVPFLAGYLWVSRRDVMAVQ